MDTGWIISLISNVGFPIVAFLLMYKLVTNHLEKMCEAIDKLEKVINDNSKVISELKLIIEERLRR